MSNQGTYADICRAARIAAEADGILLVVINGKLGSGFVTNADTPAAMASLPAFLRELADDIERGARNGSGRGGTGNDRTNMVG